MPWAVREKSSKARPSSELEMSKSVQRIKNVAPLGMLRSVMLAVIKARFAAAFPSSGPAVAAVLGLEKSSALTSAYVPAVRVVAFVLIWKSSLSAAPRFDTPARHCSPVYEIVREVIVAPVLFIRRAPMMGTRLPLRSPPKARSAAEAAPKL
jgi:hypothetical protein